HSASADPPAKGSTLEDSVQALAGEVRELNATIQELRAEVARSRQETRDLRAELHGVIEKVSSTGTGAGMEGKSALSVSETRATTQDPPPLPAAGNETSSE